MKLPELNGFQLEISDRLIYALVSFSILVCVYVLASEVCVYVLASKTQKNAKRSGEQSQVKRPCGCKEQPVEPLGKVSADDER